MSTHGERCFVRHDGGFTFALLIMPRIHVALRPLASRCAVSVLHSSVCVLPFTAIPIAASRVTHGAAPSGKRNKVAEARSYDGTATKTLNFRAPGKPVFVALANPAIRDIKVESLCCKPHKTKYFTPLCPREKCFLTFSTARLHLANWKPPRAI